MQRGHGGQAVIVQEVTALVYNADLGSRERAMQLFPASAELFQRKKDDGRSDATLIAKYGATQGEHP